MKQLLLFILFTFILSYSPAKIYAQTNYTTGDVNDCYTWARLANQYTTLKDINVLNSTTITCNTNINANSIYLIGGSSKIDFNSGNYITLNGSTTDVKCGTIYGEDKGDGTWVYYTPSNCSFINNGSATGTSVSFTLGHFRKTAWHRITQVQAIFFNSSNRWTTDWNLNVDSKKNNDAWRGVQSFSIWYNRGSVQSSGAAQTINAAQTCSFITGGSPITETFARDFSLGDAGTSIHFNKGDTFTVTTYLTGGNYYTGNLMLLLNIRIEE